jgi:hypothetical protein
MTSFAKIQFGPQFMPYGFHVPFSNISHFNRVLKLFSTTENYCALGQK